MKRLSLNKDGIHSGNLILVNKSYPLVRKESEVVNSLTLTDDYPSQILLEMRTAIMLSQLINILNCRNSIVAVSGYRSSKEQQKIYIDSIKQHGGEFTSRYVALPQRSEHQTGMAVDLAEKAENIDFIRPHFPYSGICQKFRQKAIKYGFVERYPKDKEKITQIAHEPWHFRYVGYPHSEIMQNNNLTLEEYIDFIKGYYYSKKHLILSQEHHMNEIFYVNAFESTQVEVELPEDVPYQVSGNNVDGYIITLWRENV